MSKDNTQGVPQQPAGESDKADGTKMVVVGCKLPHGLICELGKLGSDDYRSVRLRGANESVVGGYGFTDVSEAFMGAWLKKNQRLEFVKNGAIFIHGNEQSARGHAKDHDGVKTGFERLNYAAPPKGIEVDQNHLAQASRDLSSRTFA
jgi:hypothetical protein